MKLKQKEILIATTGNPSIDFWDSNNYKKLHSIKGHNAWCLGKKTIELPNGLIAISSCASGSPLLIIDPLSYSIIKEIKEQEYITGNSSLCVLDPYSFVYVYDGKVLQISIGNEYRILYKTNAEQQLHGEYGLISVKGGEYLIVVNNSKTGFEVVKPYY